MSFRIAQRMTSRTMNRQRAIIDIGSNTVRLVIYGGPPRAPVILLNEKVTARLGRAVAERGELSDRASAAALAALARYAMILDLRGVTDVECVATAAVRDAANGAVFLDRVRAIGLTPRLLSGEEEAIASAQGVLGAFPGARGAVADLGGGSLELVHVGSGGCEHGVSLPLGSLRLPALREGGPVKFGRRIHRAVTDAKWSGAAEETLYLVGGSHRAIARVAMRLIDWPLDDPHGFTIDAEEMSRVSRVIVRGKVPHDIPGVGASRCASLGDTAALLGVLVREIEPARVVFSTWGLREGLLYSRLSRATREQDPLLAGVAAFCEAVGSPAAEAAMVAGWTVATNPVGGHGTERLRLAATMLALASLRIEPNLRPDEATDWALRKSWVGIEPEGRAMIAACVHANASRQPVPTTLGRLAAEERLREAAVWGASIRLCRRFSALAPAVLAGSSLAIEGKRLVLSAAPRHAALFTDTVAKDLAVLAAQLDLEPKFAT